MNKSAINSVPTVVITDLSNRISYYQWFVYGFMLLAKDKSIELKFKTPLFQKLWLVNHASFLVRCLNKLKRMFTKKVGFVSKAYLRGYIKVGKKKFTFCIDSADSPNMFSKALLKSVDVYFKMQCPKSIENRGFKMGNIYLPYFDCEFAKSEDKGKQKAPRRLCPEVYTYQSKIKPLMVAVRSMGYTYAFHELDISYKKLLSARKVLQSEKAMCYFGNAKGPKPSVNVTEPDYDWEADILGYYGDQMNHPNEKRAKIAEILSSLGEGYDARIINDGNSDQGKTSNKDLIIPLKDFSKHVAKVQYNINVSGYRMSIPARFIDSFICGTAIATDNLAVKWYHPFGDEVCEIGEMGYLPDDEVNYSAIKEKLKMLKPISREYVIEQYEKYWSPKAVAKYIVDTLCTSAKI